LVIFIYKAVKILLESDMSKALNVIILCYTGASSSYFVESLKEEARNRKVELVIDSYTVSPFPTDFTKYDVILIAPQVKHCIKQVEKIVDKTKIPIIPIDFTTFGLHETGKVLDQILNVIG
jgi:PTS system cellobiose-specific IIB component